MFVDSWRGMLLCEALDEERWTEGPVLVEGLRRGAGAGGGAMIFDSCSADAGGLVTGASVTGVLMAGDAAWDGGFDFLDGGGGGAADFSAVSCAFASTESGAVVVSLLVSDVLRALVCELIPCPARLEVGGGGGAFFVVSSGEVTVGVGGCCAEAT